MDRIYADLVSGRNCVLCEHQLVEHEWEHPIKTEYLAALSQLLDVSENDLLQNFLMYVRFCTACATSVGDIILQAQIIERAKAKLLSWKENIQSKLLSTIGNWQEQLERLEGPPKPKDRSSGNRKRKLQPIPTNLPYSTSTASNTATAKRNRIKTTRIPSKGNTKRKILNSAKENKQSELEASHGKLTTEDNVATTGSWFSRGKTEKKRKLDTDQIEALNQLTENEDNVQEVQIVVEVEQTYDYGIGAEFESLKIKTSNGSFIKDKVSTNEACKEFRDVVMPSQSALKNQSLSFMEKCKLNQCLEDEKGKPKDPDLGTLSATLECDNGNGPNASSSSKSEPLPYCKYSCRCGLTFASHKSFVKHRTEDIHPVPEFKSA